jgi:predicted nucleotidyltransferase
MTEDVQKQLKKFTMSSYKINYEQLRQQPELTEMLSALERGFKKFGIDYYLVGAVARDVWMSGINNIAPRRTTGDIDFGVLINDKGVYEALKNYLIETEGFHPTKENAFVLLWKDKMEVDLLPFGSIEDEDGKVTVQGTGYTSIHVPGFNEVYEEGLPELELEDEHRFKFCTLPGIVVLKLRAWDDRPEVRRDDVKDISDILNHFFNMYDNEIWEKHHDLFTDEDIDLRHIAARVMGREMSKIARRNKKLFTRIENILHANTNNIASSKMADIMIEYFENTAEDNVKLLEQLKQGFIENNF